jgi:hypothetical protein
MPEPVNISLLKGLSDNTRKFLDLSTAHIRLEDVPWLNKNTYITDNGWLVYAGLNRDNVVDCPDAISNLTKIAEAIGCGYIIFDGDGPIVEDLPTFDWDVI